MAACTNRRGAAFRQRQTCKSGLKISQMSIFVLAPLAAVVLGDETEIYRRFELVGDLGAQVNCKCDEFIFSYYFGEFIQEITIMNEFRSCCFVMMHRWKKKEENLTRIISI